MEDYNTIFNKKALNLILGLMLLTIIGAAIDTVVYIMNADFVLVYFNLPLFVLLLGISITAFFERISLKTTTYLFSYSILFNIIATNCYLRAIMSPAWEMSFLRDTSLLLLFMLFIGAILRKKDLIIYIITVILYYVIFAVSSSSSFLTENIIVITITIIGGSIVIYWITDLLKKALARNRYLEDKLKEQEGNRITME